MTLKPLIRSGQIRVRTAEELELNEPAIISWIKMKTEFVRQARKRDAMGREVTASYSPQLQSRKPLLELRLRSFPTEQRR